jgi:hypothetical protein
MLASIFHRLLESTRKHYGPGTIIIAHICDWALYSRNTHALENSDNDYATLGPATQIMDASEISNVSLLMKQRVSRAITELLVQIKFLGILCLFLKSLQGMKNFLSYDNVKKIIN